MRNIFASLLFSLAMLSPGILVAETSPNGKAYDYSSDGLYFKHLTTTTTSLVDADYIEHLIVPNEADGRSVTVIAANAFENRIDIESVKFPESVLEANYSFKGCEYLTEITFPENKTTTLKLNGTFQKTAVVKISLPEYVKISYTFDECKDLKEVTFLGKTNTSSGFMNCTSLTSVTFADNMEYIGGFRGCTALESISIPSSVKTIYGDAFRGCTKLATVSADNSSIEAIQGYAFSGTPIKTFPKLSNLKSLSNNAFEYCGIEEFEIPATINDCTLEKIFYKCENLKKLIYPDFETTLRAVPYLGSDNKYNTIEYDIYINDSPLEEITITPAMNMVSFIGCRSLKRVIFANSTVKKEYPGIFSDCRNLEYVEVGAGVHNFSLTFYNCSKLKEVKVSDKNKTDKLGWSTFMGCSSLESVEFPNVTEMGTSVFEGCSALKNVSLPKLTKVEQDGFRDCSALESVELTNVTELGYRCFENCTSLKSISMPLAQITDKNNSSSIFKGCTALETVNLPSLSFITNSMFANCSSLSDITLGKNVEIEDGAFTGCSALKKFDFSNVLKIGSSSFRNSGLTEVVLNPTTVLSQFEFPFNNCPDLKKLVIWNDTQNLTLNQMPSLEHLEIKGNTPWFSMENCMSNQPAKLIFNGNVNHIAAVHRCPKLETLEFHGKIGLMKSNSNWELFRYSYGIRKVMVTDLNNWLDCKFEGDGSAPGYDAPVGEVDFYVGDEKLTHLHVPAGKNIQDHSFTNFPIEEVTIDYDHLASPVTIGNRAFHLCTKLKKFNILGTVTSIGGNAFAGSGLESFVIPESVTTLGDGTFSSCPELKSVVIPTGIKHLPNGFTHNCPKLEKLIIPEGVETVGYYITTNSNLKYLSLPSTLKTVSMYLYYDTFQNLPTDTEVWSWATTPPDGGRAVFQGLTVHVPTNSGDAYRRMNIWRDAKIVEDIETGHSCEVNGTAITIQLPNNNYHSLGKPAKYVVDVYETDSNGEETLYKTFEFDADGNLVLSRSGDGVFRLNIPELNQNTTYNYYVKGYTTSGELVSSHNGSAQTGLMTGIDDNFDNQLSISDGAITLPTSTAGSVIQIYSIDGQMVDYHKVADGEISYTLSHLNPGMYIIRIGDKVMKVTL